MKILISGANGVVGSDLVKFFSKKNKVYALFRTPNSINKDLNNKNIIWIKHDLKKKIKKNFEVQMIIHCAVTHSLSKNKNLKDLINSNILGFLNVIEFAKRNKIQKLFHLSSVNVYGDIKSKVLNEETSFKFPDLLGCSKILMEKMLENEKIQFLNIRLPGVVGYQINDKRRPWLCKIINQFKENKNVTIFNSSKLFNNIVDSYEIYRFINFLKNKKLKNDTLNFSASKPIVLRKIISKIQLTLSSNSKIRYSKKKTKHFIISTSKVYRNYKFKISSTNNILDRYLKDFSNSLINY